MMTDMKISDALFAEVRQEWLSEEGAISVSEMGMLLHAYEERLAAAEAVIAKLNTIIDQWETQSSEGAE